MTQTPSLSAIRPWVGGLCLLLSGGAGLVYQQVWSHHFSIVFGSSELATASVLGIYLAGLGAGAALALRRCHRSRNPLRTYALLEGLVALSALVVPIGTRAAQGLFHDAFAVDGLPVASLSGSWLFQLATTALLLALPTLALGASLPYAIRGLVRDPEAPGRQTAWLYTANTFGAVLGSLGAGLAVIPALGISAATWVAAALSLLAAALALAVSRASGFDRDGVPPREMPRPPLPFAAVVLLGGVATLGYEVLWTRLLIHFVGSGLYALSILLAVFLLGLAVGSALAGLWGVSPRQNARGLVLAQLAGAVVSITALVALEHWTGSGRPALVDFGERLSRTAWIALATLLPISVAAGAAFIFAVKVVTRSADEAAPAVARAYQWTAVGNLVGAVGVATWALPTLGFTGTAIALALVSLVVAVLASGAAGWRRPTLAAGAAYALVLIAASPGEPLGILTFNPLTGSTRAGSPLFVRVGANASVVVTEESGEWRLQTNGLTEGSIQRPGVSGSRYLVTRWLGALPFLARPQAQDALLVGLGAGITLDAIPASVPRVAVVEIESEVVAANRELAAQRRVDPLADPRVELVVNDARDVLYRTRRTFDVILSQPSHPWTAGSANLYTVEFLRGATARLRPGGLFVQWVGLPFVDEALLRSVLATVAGTFAEVEVYRPPTGAALIIMASDRPISTRAPASPTSALLALGIRRQEDVAAARVLDTRGVRALAEGALPVSDDRNLLATGSPRILGRGLARSLADGLLAPHDPLPAERDLDAAVVTQRLLELGPFARAQRFAQSLPTGSARQLSLALLARSAGQPAAARALAADAASATAQTVAARALLLELDRPRLARGGAPDPALGALQPIEELMVNAWRAMSGSAWGELRALDEALAAVPPEHPLYDEGLMLRAQWRARSRDAADQTPALALLDQTLARRTTPQALLLYAMAASGLGLEAGVETALSDLAALPPAQRPPLVAAAVRSVLQQHFGPRRWAPWAEDLVSRIERPPH